MGEHILSTRNDAVGFITIDRQHRFGSLDVETARDLRKAALQMARDETVRVVVLRGTGGVFCSGADMKAIRAGASQQDLGYLQPAGTPARQGYGENFKQILEYLHSTISEVRRAAKPFLAAVDGSAAAGGMGLALCCDLVLASERSTFEYAYFKTGLCGAESSTLLLPKLMGLRRALDFALLGRKLTAREALTAGLVSEVFSDTDFDAQVLALAQRLAQGPTAAYAAAKRLMNEGAGLDRLDHHLDRELEALVRSADSTDFAEGIDAFFAKRPAHFGGD